MISFRDMTFCAADCSTLDCPRQFNARQHNAAIRWWGGPGAPVAFADMSSGCDDYAPTGGVGTNQANDSTVTSQSPKPDRMERSAISPSPPPPTIRPDTGDA